LRLPRVRGVAPIKIIGVLSDAAAIMINLLRGFR
jgi:hypothetical protein